MAHDVSPVVMFLLELAQTFHPGKIWQIQGPTPSDNGTLGVGTAHFFLLTLGL